MKSLTLATALLVLYMGLSVSSTSIPELEPPKITFGKAISQNCDVDLANADAEVIFFELIAVEHPLGPNTCGDFHSIPSMDMDTSTSDDVGIRFVGNN